VKQLTKDDPNYRPYIVEFGPDHTQYSMVVVRDEEFEGQWVLEFAFCAGATSTGITMDRTVVAHMASCFAEALKAIDEHNTPD
jgi:hypothetical protein